MSLTPAFRYINAAELAALIKAKPTGAGTAWAVVDVRDDDFAGGNIVGALNVPSDTLTTRLEELVQRFADGPRYAEARPLFLKDAPAQEILVLRDGFTGFQQLYRDDPVLIEKFNKYYHD